MSGHLFFCFFFCSFPYLSALPEKVFGENDWIFNIHEWKKRMIEDDTMISPFSFSSFIFLPCLHNIIDIQGLAPRWQVKRNNPISAVKQFTFRWFWSVNVCKDIFIKQGFWRSIFSGNFCKENNFCMVLVLVVMVGDITYICIYIAYQLFVVHE